MCGEPGSKITKGLCGEGGRKVTYCSRSRVEKLLTAAGAPRSSAEIVLRQIRCQAEIVKKITIHFGTRSNFENGLWTRKLEMAV